MGNKGSKGPQPEKGGNPANPSSESKAAPTKKKGASSNCLKRPAKEQPIGIAPPPLSSEQVVKIQEVTLPALPMAQDPAVADGNAARSSKQTAVKDEKGPLNYEQLSLKREILLLKEAIKQATFEHALLLDMLVITQLDGDELNNILEDSS